MINFQLTSMIVSSTSITTF